MNDPANQMADNVIIVIGSLQYLLLPMSPLTNLFTYL